MKRLLWIGDAGVPSGFARATHAILDTLRFHYDVTVLGMNYRGDPEVRRLYAYDVWPAAPGGDSLGVGRLIWMCDRVQPHVIIIQNDPWFIKYYLKQLRAKKETGEYKFPEHAAIPVIVNLAVDGKNFRGEWIQDVAYAVFWTNFALGEARKGGYIGEARVIPLGVDTSIFYPVERHGALERQKAVGLKDRFVVGNVNRNQPRKRMDLTIKYFAEWVKSYNVKDASLFLHAAPTGDNSANIPQLAQYYGVLNRLAFCEPEIWYGKSEEDMRDTYNCFDVQISTTQGEGFGLPHLEGMACGVPQILPEWSALGDWAKGAAAMVPCTSTALQSDGLSVIGGIADEKAFVHALDTLYRDAHHRAAVGHLGHERATDPRFSWSQIGEAWLDVLTAVLEAPEPEPDTEAVWQEVGATGKFGPDTDAYTQTPGLVKP